MNECSYLLLIFFVIVGSINSTIHPLPNAIIEHVCENDFLTLQCSQDNETIQIIRSMYGRTSQRICNQHLIDRVWEKTCANIEQSKYQTKSRCQGKSTCEILINNQIFTDPCGGNIPKHFEIHYRCIHRENVCMKLFLNCSKSKDLQCVKNVEEEFSCQCPSNICQYVDEKFVGFIENICPEEKLQGFHWPKTPIHKNRSLSCPSPCTGEVSRICHSNHQWSTVNYTHCQCPIDTFDQVKTSSLSTHHSASSYRFQCNFWLINRILPEENSCLHSFTNWQDETTEPLMCLLNAFEHMHFQSCFDWKKSFAIDFANLAFEIALPRSNENHLELFSKQIIVDRTEIIRDNFRANLPMMMMIDKRTKTTTTSHSIILVEQENDFNSLQTANVTLTFHHQSAEIRYQCRAYHSTNFSLNLNSSNMFFACQLLCSNGSHVICQCPFFNPFMQYILQIDRSQTENELLIENDLNERCTREERVTPTDKIDRYLNEIPSLTFVKKLLLFIERTIEKQILVSNWKIIEQIQSLAIRIQQITDSFISISNHLEFFLQSNFDQFENSDRSIVITIHPSMKDNSMLFFTLSNVHTHLIFNSRIVTLKSMSKNISIDHIQIIFRHRNQSYPMSTCANLNDQMQWTTDQCQLIATNLTHTICSCRDWSTVALLIDFSKPMSNSTTDNRLLFISKIGSIISIICVLLTIFILLLIRSHVNINDDLTHIRNILHTNMFLCLIFVQILFLFGIDQMKNQIYCRMSSILLDYFLLATFSWMFVDGIELLIAVKHIFQIDRIRLIAYSIYSYGLPLLIIILSIGFSSKASIGLSRYCWLSHDNAFIWAFGIPFMLLILGNLGFFLMSICAICSNSNATEYKKRLRHSLRDISLLSILFGITWLLAMFYLYDQTIFLAYVFTTLNSLHGFLILVIYYFSPVHFRILLEKLHLCQIHCRSFFDCSRSNHPTHNKSFECFSLPDTTSSSDYSSGHSFDLNGKHPSCQQTTQQFLTRSMYNHRRITSNNEPCYLPSVSINLLSNRLSTFRYPLPTNEVLLTQEQNEELLGKTSLPSEDDHQYYEIR